MANTLPWALITLRYSYGKLPLSKTFTPILAILPLCLRWPGRPMGNTLPLAIVMALCSYGMLSAEAILTLIVATLITTQAITHQALPSIAWPGRLMGST